MTRFGYFLATAVAGQLAAALAFFNPAPRLVWNVSASAPVGLYRVSPGQPASSGALSLIEPDKPLALWLARRHYLPLGVPLIKRVAATAGQSVCRTGDRVTIDGREVAVARRHDRAGRPLPVWTGCRTLRAEEMFLLNEAADSLDGRYFGPVSTRGMIGVVRPVLTRTTPQGDLHWQGNRQ